MLLRRLGEGAPTSVLVDTAPELRQQTAAAGVKHLDAVLYTHDHADQVHGIDDVRAFLMTSGRRIPAYMDAPTRARLTSRFHYVFEGEGPYPALMDAVDMPPLNQPFALEGPGGAVPVVAFDQDHGGVRSLGFRFGPIAYSSDLVGLPEESFEVLKGVEVWIVDALRWKPHPTHAHVEMALSWIERVRPRRAVLTNLHIDLDYETLKRWLPSGVEPAFDGMSIEAALA
jgi:phosphoribosyl 1,2-cyclic phosphate phosphodiesterase